MSPAPLRLVLGLAAVTCSSAQPFAVAAQGASVNKALVGRTPEGTPVDVQVRMDFPLEGRAADTDLLSCVRPLSRATKSCRPGA